MGAIMSVGIAVSNSILVVSFANDLRSRNESLTPFEAVIEAGQTRLRPILMTALAMIIGMVPMALALGEAGEQNAPLGRAVIGGLAFATVATLILVPIFYTLLRRQLPTLHTLDKRFEAEAAGSAAEVPYMAEDQAATASRSGRSIKFYLVGGAFIVAALAAVGYFHLSRSQNVATAREARANVVDRGPRVEVVAASQGPSERTVTMLADVRANTTAIMYAKVSGYMKSVLVDRGDRVQAGQIIAVIESPEIDQQYNAAVTDLEHKRRNLARSQDLLAKGNTTQVAMLQFETDVRVAESNVKGLETMKGYQILRAPFAGG
jgi:hypothetical protein